ncbi:phosphoribosyltransferase [Actinacidiphila paucisporea]|uniref:Predicted phosphoribosyltransferase n=1 Tax=Actinacidiphila paucisporea TaxID=310782 RepID=A0A1M7NQZ1_9ACTN|nr:phosphoribosyltransferase [Actinacidiphila paucisporea]SHN06222.1 Predicted phosphoribosyltransferase [Actinacidiphila paucisporea]
MFHDRQDAGRRLAARCGHLKGRDVVVLGLPRGGVPVAEEVARTLRAPLDVCVVRKLGVPYQPELGMGAIGEGDTRVVNDEVVRKAGVSADDLYAVEQRERVVLRQRAHLYRGERPPMPLAGRTAVVVDDGIATGSTARAACRIARERGARRVVLAVPVAPADWTDRLAGAADQYICVQTPSPFHAIGLFYEDFTQTADAEVTADLARAAQRDSGGGEPDPDGQARPRAAGKDVGIPTSNGGLAGELTVPDGARGIVVFAHGSGSSHRSPRNRRVAAALNEAGLGTLLFDLLTEAEGDDRANVFDTELLAGRLTEVTEWLAGRPEAEDRAVGYFGASTGAAAALYAAADLAGRVAAIVSRGGRPDLAGPRLSDVQAPTLLIVGGLDHHVLDLNRHAQQQLRCENRLALVPGATHLFEEPGALAEVGALATDWFAHHLARAPSQP